jgi:hypothetical protein
VRSYVNPWLMVLLGVGVCVSACVKPIAVVEPTPCPPYTLAQLEEQEALADAGAAPALRAWVRETERVCRANEALIDDE